jgi:PD-(D/E)XK nuclease superfamily
MTWSDKHSISFTSFNEFEQCPKKFFHRHIAKDYPKQASSEALDWGNAVHKAIELRLKPGKRPLPENMQQFESFCHDIESYPVVITERNYGVSWEGEAREPYKDGCAVTAKGDIILMNADRSLAFTLDIKTGKPREDPFQLYLQAIVVMAHFPEIKGIKGSYYWTQDARMGPMYDLTEAWDKCMPRLIAMADGVDERVVSPLDPSKFAAVPGEPFPCKWCHAPCEYAGFE